jgi:hypothetical protein
MKHFEFLDSTKGLQEFRQGLLRLKRSYYRIITRAVMDQFEVVTIDEFGLKETSHQIEVHDHDEEIDCWVELEKLYNALPPEDRYVIAREGYLEKYFSFVYWDTVNEIEKLYNINQ